MRSLLIFGLLALSCLFNAACKGPTGLVASGQHYQEHRDYQSLKKVVDLIELGADTSLVRQLLGEPIDMGFDYRYTLDSVGPNDCVVGAVFHIDEQGKIDQKWLDEICE